MSYRRHAPNPSDTNASLEFLKTVVSDGSNVERSDSDKENDHRLMTISEESTEGKSVPEGSKEQGQGRRGQSEDHLILGNTPTPNMAKDEDKDMWEDFYNEKDFQVKKDDPVFANGALEMDHGPKEGLDNNRVLDKVEEEQEGTDDYSSVFDSSVRDDDVSHEKDDVKEESHTSKSQRKRPRKKKKLFQRRLPPSIVSTSQTTGGSHPDLGRPDGNQAGHQLETMSESGGVGDRGRRLHRRKQVSRPRCAGPMPSGDVLQQKYQELEHLVLTPLPNPAVYVKQTRQQMLRLQGLSSQYHASNHAGNRTVVEGLPPNPGNPREEDRRHNQVIVEEVSDQGYSTLRTIQVVQGGTNAHTSTSTRHNRPQTAHPSRKPNSAHRRPRPASAGRERPASANPRLRENTGTFNANSQKNTRGRRIQRGGGNRGRGARSLSGSGGSGQVSLRSDNESKDRSSRDSRDSCNTNSDNQSRSNSRSPSRIIPPTETHLKHSSNPEIRQWLKTKNKQQRHQKVEERKKKQQERLEKQEIERKKQEYLQDSEKKVKEWMIKKRKEARRKAKEEKKKAVEEEMERSEREGGTQYTGSLRGHSIERPQSAPSHGNRKMFIPVIRPDGDQAMDMASSGGGHTPQPPQSKFVYKRPVSGRVRLMKLQQERKEETKKRELKKKEMEALSEEEKNRKMRMSYDQWLLKKRQEDYQKRQKTAEQRALAKSDPELERIVPEIARRRIENIQRGKKRIQTDVPSIDDTVNRSFGGGDFGEEQNADNQEPPGLQISGHKKSLDQRPSSAKPSSGGSPLHPQISKSPRRPKSAHPRVQSCMDASNGEEEAKAFQLPFPPELGVPKYVAQRQEKLFSSDAISKASTNASLSSSSVIAEAEDLPQAPVPGQEGEAGSESGSGQTKTLDESHTGDQESDSLDQQPSCSAQDNDEPTDAKTEETKEDDTFFVTEGNIVYDEVVVTKMCEAVEAEIMDDEDMLDSSQEDNVTESENHGVEESNVNFDADEDAGEANIEFDDDEDEQEKAADEENTAGDENTDEEKLKAMTVEEKIPAIEELQALDKEVEAEVEEEQLAVLEEPVMENLEELSTAAEDTNQEKGEEKEEKEESHVGQVEEEEAKSEVSESKASTKHVSFVEEAIIHEDPLAGIRPEDYEMDTDNDEAEDERGDFFGDDNDSPRSEEDFWAGNNVQEQNDDDNDDDTF